MPDIDREERIRSLVHEEILKLKDQCYYPYGRNASNELEGDYGTWQDWEDKIMSIVTIHSKLAVDEALINLEKFVKYNKHDMGELGEFIRTQYIYNSIENERKKALTVAIDKLEKER